MCSQLYNPEQIEQSAQQYWDEQLSFQVTEDLSKEKFYCLAMFPYPSGSLHMGHIRNYTLTDVIARYQKTLGKNVLNPIGWDAFGLPAENAAIKNKVTPAKWTKNNIDKMRSQLKSFGFSYDWKREISTINPLYYRWEQHFFLKLYEKGLIYKKNSKVNWDPIDQTVLANEQVVDGKGWRSGALVEQKEIPLWFMKITNYADELLNDLDQLKEWPPQVITMQKNWIGRSEGVNIYFDIEDQKYKRIKVFTTRADTLLGTTFLAISPDYSLATQLAKENDEIAQFIESCKNVKLSEADLETQEKRGISTDLMAINPITNEKIPIWIANFVLADYGYGAIIGVPAHDQRDWDFARKYNLSIKQVLASKDKQIDIKKSAYCDEGYLINSQQFNGLTTKDAIDEIAKFLESKKLGQKHVCYRLRDWSISRQRYWGTPIPIINCPECGAVPVPKEDLPVVLPTDVTFSGCDSPLHKIPDFYNVSCPKCGGDATRETDTLDTFVNSSWYYARFACKNQENVMLDDRAKYWTPVDYYIGGIEHAILHLLYARFFHKLLRDEGLLNSDEPFQKLLTLGMVLNEGCKMSKAKGNTVAPETITKKYGVDTLRHYIIFAAPPEQSFEWTDANIEGSHRFLKKLWNFSFSNVLQDTDTNEFDCESANQSQKEIRKNIYQIFQQIDYDYQRSQFNTVASGIMKVFNIIQKLSTSECDKIDKFIIREGYVILLKILAPICPHITHQLWFNLGNSRPIIEAPWPKIAKEALKNDVIKFAVQINGKLRGHFSAYIDDSLEKIESTILVEQFVVQYTKNKIFMKSIILPERKLINLVFKDQ